MTQESSGALVRPTQGRWTTGPHQGEPGTLVDVDVGWIVVRRSDGSEVGGAPEAFLSASGESGDSLLAAVLKPPSCGGLFRGAVREALAEAYSTAKVGCAETHAWEKPMDYVADDGEGNTGVVRFRLGGAVAAICDHESTRSFRPDEAIALAPPDLRVDLAAVCNLPLLNSTHPMSAVFWTRDGSLSGPEPWWQTYLAGARLFRRELLPPSSWVEEGSAHYGLPDSVASMVLRIAARAQLAVPLLALSAEELHALVPPGSPHEEEAIASLFDGQLFERATSP